MVMEATEERVLTAHDRCDKCGVQAYFLVIFDTGELNFCLHHFNKNEALLRESAYHIVDQSEALAVGRG